MGLIANYSCLSDANLKELKAMGSEEEEILESVEEWNDDDEEEEEIKDELLHDFEQMKRFYKQVLDTNGHVLVSIC